MGQPSQADTKPTTINAPLISLRTISTAAALAQGLLNRVFMPAQRMVRHMAASPAPKGGTYLFHDNCTFVLTYIIRAEEIDLLGRLPPDYPRPVAMDWINRGTDQALRPSTIAMLKRTLDQGSNLSESVRKLHTSAGLRLTFASARERATFAAMIRAVKLNSPYFHPNGQSERSDGLTAEQSRD